MFRPPQWSRREWELGTRRVQGILSQAGTVPRGLTWPHLKGGFAQLFKMQHAYVPLLDVGYAMKLDFICLMIGVGKKRGMRCQFEHLSLRQCNCKSRISRGDANG